MTQDGRLAIFRDAKSGTKEHRGDGGNALRGAHIDPAFFQCPPGRRVPRILTQTGQLPGSPPPAWVGWSYALGFNGDGPEDKMVDRQRRCDVRIVFIGFRADAICPGRAA